MIALIDLNLIFFFFNRIISIKYIMSYKQILPRYHRMVIICSELLRRIWNLLINICVHDLWLICKSLISSFELIDIFLLSHKTYSILLLRVFLDYSFKSTLYNFNFQKLLSWVLQAKLIKSWYTTDEINTSVFVKLYLMLELLAIISCFAFIFIYWEAKSNYNARIILF